MHGIVPVREHIFDCFQDLQPRDIKLIALGPGPIPSATSASGYSLLDASASSWTEKLPSAMQRLFDALKAHAEIDGRPEYTSLAAWSSISPRGWFEFTKKQGVLWLNTCLTRSLDTARTSGDEVRERSYWLPVILRVIRYLMEIKSKDPKNTGLVFALFGAEGSSRYDDITFAVSKYFTRFSSTLSIRTYKAPDPLESAFKLDEDSNPFAEMSASLMETNNTLPTWFPPSSKKALSASAKATISHDMEETETKSKLQKKRTLAEMSKPATLAEKADGPCSLQLSQNLAVHLTLLIARLGICLSSET